MNSSPASASTSKVVFDSQYNFFGILMLIMLPLISLGGFAFLCTKFWDRPVIIGIMAVIALVLTLSASAEKIVVGTDRFSIVTIRVLPMLTQRKTFLYSSVAAITASLPLTQAGDFYQSSRDMGKTPLWPTTQKKYNRITVRYKDGVEVELSPSIYRGTFHKALDHIRSLSDIAITASDQ